MGATSLPSVTLDMVLEAISQKLPQHNLKPGEQLRWSPATKTIVYKADDESIENIWGLLHEAGHASLDHKDYDYDVELLQCEVAAWDEANDIGGTLGIKIDPEHVQDCLDTYRDWVHQRSTCPRCGVVTFQAENAKYECYNCHKVWLVTQSRMCRPYRKGI